MYQEINIRKFKTKLFDHFPHDEIIKDYCTSTKNDF